MARWSAAFTDFGPPFNIGPVADAIESEADRLGWHEHDPLPPNSTRRRRRLDVWRDGARAVAEGFFRDSHVDANGVETVVHEYTVRATVDPVTLAMTECDATPGPLPYPECPGAAAERVAASWARPPRVCGPRSSPISPARRRART